jgi:hypothetical protein
MRNDMDDAEYELNSFLSELLSHKTTYKTLRRLFGFFNSDRDPDVPGRLAAREPQALDAPSAKLLSVGRLYRAPETPAGAGLGAARPGRAQGIAAITWATEAVSFFA